MMPYFPGARVRHLDGGEGEVIRLTAGPVHGVEDGTITVRWDDGTENDWDPEEQEAMIRFGSLPE